MAKGKDRIGIHGSDKETNRVRGDGDGTKKPAANGGAKKEKAPCPITRDRFNEKAKPIVAHIGDSPVILNPQEFTTGSFGFFMNGRMEITVDGVKLPCQANLIVTVIGSKPDPDAPKPAPAPVKKAEPEEETETEQEPISPEDEE